ncbi:hypothetical protein DV738_g4637, partial [Chaetothyriales sp. CBS 135597]
MRTSRLSQDTARIVGALSSNGVAPARITRSRLSLAAFALGSNGDHGQDSGDGSVSIIEPKQEPDDRYSALWPAQSDIEDGPERRPIRGSRKRKRDEDTTTDLTGATGTDDAAIKKEERNTVKTEPVSPSPPRKSVAKARKRVPAKRIASPNGTYTTAPPADWEELYNTVAVMRRNNPTAPVDTMGCEELFWPTSTPKEQRYHTLTSLMLSSQTKDAVTAAAMHRLHTELAPRPPLSEADQDSGKDTRPSALTVQAVLDCDPKFLDSLIGKVGFHNNKTKYIKQTAQILRDQYDDDIPSTVEGLTSLPGVGPKMAYLCMSAAWGVDEGIGVDVHVHRITNLWGWHATKTPEETRMRLQEWLPRSKWHEINKMLVGLGQTVCLPIGRRCGECAVAGTGLCKAEVRGWKDVRDSRKTGRKAVKQEKPVDARIKVETAGT